MPPLTPEQFALHPDPAVARWLVDNPPPDPERSRRARARANPSTRPPATAALHTLDPQQARALWKGRAALWATLNAAPRSGGGSRGRLTVSLASSRSRFIPRGYSIGLVRSGPLLLYLLTRGTIGEAATPAP